MIKYSEIFFESYSLAVEAAYEAYLKIVGGEFPRDDAGMENKLSIYLQNEYKKWLDTPQEKLAGKTPAEYMNSIESLDDMMVMFSHGAVICDESLPAIYVEKLKSYGENAVDSLIDTALSCKACQNNDLLLTPLMAIKVLGMWKVERSVEPLIRMLDSDGEMFDLMFETVKDALINIGASALDSIANALESGIHSQTVNEYLLMAYAEIGKKYRNDRIYMLLKKTFLRMPEKLVAASCLGDYGDGRAIPVLRGYAEKSGKSLDKQTFFEIVSAIQKLGGNAGDLTRRN